MKSNLISPYVNEEVIDIGSLSDTSIYWNVTFLPSEQRSQFVTVSNRRHLDSTFMLKVYDGTGEDGAAKTPYFDIISNCASLCSLLLKIIIFLIL